MKGRCVGEREVTDGASCADYTSTANFLHSLPKQRDSLVDHRVVVVIIPDSVQALDVVPNGCPEGLGVHVLAGRGEATIGEVEGHAELRRE